jgi:hypothetical protein
VAGSAAGGGAITDFSDNLFTIYNVSDSTKIVDFDLSGLTTGFTRTITPSDAAMTIPDTVNWTDLTDAGNTALHVHDIYLLADGTRSLTGDWDAGDFQITAGDLYLAAGISWDGELTTDGDATIGGALSADSGEIDNDLDVLGTLSVNTIQEQSPAAGITLGHDVYLDASSDPSLFLRPGGSTTDLAEIKKDLSGLFISNTDNAGQSLIQLDPLVTDGSSDTLVYFFRNSVTTGTPTFSLYEGDGTAVVHHTFETGDSGDITLCQQGGDVTIEEGNLYLDKAADPTIFLREGGDAASYTTLTDLGDNEMELTKVHDDGGVFMKINPMPSATGDANVQVFRNTNTTGDCDLLLYVGDGTATLQHTFSADSGDISLCQVGGDVTIEEGGLYLDKTTSPSIYLREAGSTTDYTRMYDDGGSMRIERFDVGGHSYLYLDADTSHPAGGGFVNVGRYTNAALGAILRLFEGDGTTTIQTQFRASGYNSYINSQGGNLVVGSTTTPNEKFEVHGGSILIQNNQSYKAEDTSGTNHVLAFIDTNDLVNFGNTSLRSSIRSLDVVKIDAPSSAPADATMSNGEVAFWLDESGNNLSFKVKYSSGTVKNGSVAVA